MADINSAINLLSGAPQDGAALPPPDDVSRKLSILTSPPRETPKEPAKATSPRSPSMGATAPLMQGAGMGFSDEIGAAGAATGGFLKSLTNDLMAGKLPSLSNASTAAGQSYDRRLDELRQDVSDYAKEHPVLSTAATVLGGIAGARSLPSFMAGTSPGYASMIGRGAIEGGLYGGLYGFGSGEGGFQSRLASAAPSATLGAITGGTMGAVGARAANKTADKTIPSTQQLKSAAQDAYGAVDNAGVVFNPQSFSKAVDDISQAATDAGIHPKIHPKATAALEELQAAKGTQPTFGDVDRLRQIIGGAASSNEPAERRVASIMKRSLDNYVSNLGPSDVVAGDPAAAASAINRARDLYQRMSKSDLIENALVRARRNADASGSGGNINNAIRQQIKSILNNPAKMRGFTPEEKQLMETVVSGTTAQNLARLVGKLSPSGNGGMAILEIMGAMHDPRAAILPAIGLPAKMFADSGTARNVAQLSRVIRSGGALPPPMPLTPAQIAALHAATITGAQQLPQLPKKILVNQ